MKMGKVVTELERSDALDVRFEFCPSLSSPLAQLRHGPYAAEIMKRAVKEADAVIVRLPSQIGLIAISVATRVGRPWAVEVVGCAWDSAWNYGTLRGKVYAPVLTWRMKQAVGNAPYALYVTREFLQRRYPCRNGITTHCSNVEIASPMEDVLKHRLAKIDHPSQGRPLVLGLIGTLRHRYKGIQTVLGALGKVRGQFPVVFRILGSGNTESWQAEAARNTVDDITCFDGTLPAGEAVLRWLDGVDIYLQPSLQEGLPRALVEAMSRGCTAIGSRAGGIPELLPPEVLIKPGDSRALAGLIVRLIENTDLRRQQAKKNWTTAGEYSRVVLEARRHNFWDQFTSLARK